MTGWFRINDWLTQEERTFMILRSSRETILVQRVTLEGSIPLTLVMDGWI